MLQWLYTYVGSFCSQCFCCFSGRMLQVCLSVTHMLHVRLSRCCLYFAMAFQAFPGVFTSVSDVRCKCFNCFRAFVANVLFGCFKSRSGVASPFLPSVAFASVSPPLLSAGDIQVTSDGLGGTSHSSGSGVQMRAPYRTLVVPIHLTKIYLYFRDSNNH
jgi:hypothetical protein